ncbi:MAG: hypothetical protein ACKPKO_10205, partial [Candidatus Fonsibacter sp.]
MLKNGVTLSTTNLEEVCPVDQPRAPNEPPTKLAEMSAESLQATVAALTALQFPEALTKPFRDIIEERTAADQHKVDHSKLYVQLCPLKNQKVKLRDVVKAEVEALQKQLGAKSKELVDYEHDV